jgi:hypothetical protein
MQKDPTTMQKDPSGNAKGANFNAKKPNSNARGIEQAKKNSIYKPQKNSKA